jgi:hypothetical protein
MGDAPILRYEAILIIAVVLKPQRPNFDRRYLTSNLIRYSRVARFVGPGRSRDAAAAHFKVSVSFVVNLMKAYRMTGSLEPKPGGGRRHAKLDPHRALLLVRVAERDDITMPELAAELAAATGRRAEPGKDSLTAEQIHIFEAVLGPDAIPNQKPGWRRTPLAA